ncbi:MAG TPA: hypothetical protein VHJ20_21845 [Polyangia bacterium]|nr:hypothetical protein [Polyangia bacterium]
MSLRRPSLTSLLVLGSVLALSACGNGDAGPAPNGGSTGNNNPGGGTTGSSTGGSTASGDTGGDTGSTGNGGSTGTSTGGDTGAGGSTVVATGGTTGSTGTGGAAAMGGSTGAGGSAPPTSTRSAGCMKDIGASDNPGTYVKRNITVTGVTFTKPATPGGSWTNRVYWLDLPKNYNSSMPYPIIFGGGGCGGSLGGGSGAFATLPTSSPLAIQVGLSYVWPNPGGACFADGYADTPDLPYFDAILKEIEDNYCVDTSKVFVGGYSSGGWESYMLGFARGGVVRGIAPAAGGLRAMADRPPPSNKPFAAIMVTGAGDTTNPATGATGSMAARDLILQINGCTGTATAPYTNYNNGNCNQYTGCPAAYPVVYCRPPGDHTDGGADYQKARWAFWMSLP